MPEEPSNRRQLDFGGEFQPSDSVSVVWTNPKTNQREMVSMMLGFGSVRANLIINAREETVAQKTMFQESFRSRRCLVVADGFRLGNHLVQVIDRSPFGLGAVWRLEDGNNRCVVISTEANSLLQPLNDRMPAIIAREDYDHGLMRISTMPTSYSG